MARKEAREFAMQAIFQMEVQSDFTSPDIEKYLTREELGEQKSYVKQLLTLISSNIETIDQVINHNSQGWPTTRMAKADLAIVRLAVGEILFMDEVPNAVAINEAVNMAKRYGTEQSPKFINAVLGKIGTAS